jgi:Holliday junction resolvase
MALGIKMKKINSRSKGARAERQWRDCLREAGYNARRGQQFSGSPDSPDVVCPDLPWAHFEVKHVEHLNIGGAMDQATSDCGGKMPIVVHRKNQRDWEVNITYEDFFVLLQHCDLGALNKFYCAFEEPA